jgi:protein AbiQ
MSGSKKAKGRVKPALCMWGGEMMSLKFFCADAEYCDFLRQTDACVPHVHDDKNTRPFVGILLSVNGIDYFAPLSSPKSKHKGMKNQVDFLKIKGGEWGAINFNNMIPIHPSCLTAVDMKISEKDDKAEADYKNLLSNQLSWCNSNKAGILSRATKLYQIIVNKQARPELAKRCCDFLKDEEQYRAFCVLHGLEIARTKQP